MRDTQAFADAVDVSGGLDLAALGERVRSERLRLRLSLDGLAARAGVSRSMLSAVETGGKAPTVLVLHRIATGLGVSMSRLLGEERSEPVILMRRHEQVVARDPSGWERRNLAPPLPGRDVEFMRTEIPPGVDAGTFPPHPEGSREYVAVEHGSLRLTIAGHAYDLNAGDSISYDAACRHGFHNPGDEVCIYYLAVIEPERGGGARRADG